MPQTLIFIDSKNSNPMTRKILFLVIGSRCNYHLFFFFQNVEDLLFSFRFIGPRNIAVVGAIGDSVLGNITNIYLEKKINPNI